MSDMPTPEQDFDADTPWASAPGAPSALRTIKPYLRVMIPATGEPDLSSAWIVPGSRGGRIIWFGL